MPFQIFSLGLFWAKNAKMASDLGLVAAGSIFGLFREIYTVPGMRSCAGFLFFRKSLVRFFDKTWSLKIRLTEKNPGTPFSQSSYMVCITDVRGFRLAFFSRKDVKKTFWRSTLSNRCIFSARRKNIFATIIDWVFCRRNKNFVEHPLASCATHKQAKSGTVHIFKI